jgi:hypothetical protein
MYKLITLLMPNKPCRALFVASKKSRPTNGGILLLIRQYPLWLSVFFFYLFISKTVQKTIPCIEGKETSSVSVYVMSHGTYTPAWVVSVYPMEKCLEPQWCNGPYFYAFLYGRMPFLKFPHFVDLEFIVLLTGTLF